MAIIRCPSPNSLMPNTSFTHNSKNEYEHEQKIILHKTNSTVPSNVMGDFQLGTNKIHVFKKFHEKTTFRVKKVFF